MICNMVLIYPRCDDAYEIQCIIGLCHVTLRMNATRSPPSNSDLESSLRAQVQMLLLAAPDAGRPPPEIVGAALKAPSDSEPPKPRLLHIANRAYMTYLDALMIVVIGIPALMSID